MRIAIHTPYGSMSQETGLIYLLSRYLADVYQDIVQLQCNGIFSLCDRDCITDWRRTLHSCPRCINDQRSLAGWSGVDVKDLSQYLAPEEVLQSKRWVMGLSTPLLAKSRFRGLDVYGLCRGSFEKRLGTSEPDLQNRKHEQTVRRLMLAALRMCLATRRFNNHFRPDISLTAYGNDFVTHAFLAQSADQKRDVALFRWDMSGRCVRIIHPRTGKIGSCELVVEEVCRMRNDYRTWPAEFLKVIEEILGFLDIPASQLTLPIAK